MVIDCIGQNKTPHARQAVLQKAEEDHFTYIMRLVTGEIVHFSKSSDAGDYLQLTDCRILFPPDLTDSKFDRGMDVRKNAIVWVADDGYVDGV